MKERPILFSGPMVRAILEGRKTQTRRVIKPVQPRADGRWPAGRNPIDDCPYGASGDRLWVRETWGHCDGGTCYRASEADSVLPDDGRWRPSIHMPRWASRIALEVTDVRVEPLNSVSEEDAKSEGVTIPSYDRDLKPVEVDGFVSGAARIAFKELWANINGLDSWDANPWVWVISFKRVEVDAKRGAA
jgi:hypothetical protein